MFVFLWRSKMIEQILLNNLPVYILIFIVVVQNHQILKKNHEILEEIKKQIKGDQHG